MAKGKLKKLTKKASSGVAGAVTQGNQSEMSHPQKVGMFYLAAIVLVIAVCVVPLTAEMATCKYRYPHKGNILVWKAHKLASLSYQANKQKVQSYLTVLLS